MLNKVRVFGGVILIGLLIFLVLSSPESEKTKVIPKETETEVTTILPVEDFKPDTLKNKAVLFVKKEENIDKTEQTLKELADTYELPIVKVYYSEEVTKFNKSQEQLVATHYPIVADIGSKLLKPENNEIPYYNEELNQNILMALSKLENKEDATKEINLLVEKSKLPKEDIQSYLDNRLKLSEIQIERPINEEEGTMLVLFDDKKEFGRVNALQQEEASLQWLLIQSGLLNLSQEKAAKAALEQLETKGEMIVSIGTSTCPFCRNTIPIVENLAKKEDVPFVYVDIDAFANKPEFNQLAQNHLSGPVENTPTVIYFKDGKEISRFVGQQDFFTIDKFIRDNRQALEVSEEKAEAEKVEETTTDESDSKE